MRARGKFLREQSIISAFDAARIRADAEAGKAKSLSKYLDELLSDEERAEKQEEEFFRIFDRQMGLTIH